MANTALKVVIEHNLVESTSSDEPYGDWSAEYQNRLMGVYFANSEYPDSVSFENLKLGQDVYVVWAEWSQGDSFGWGKNSGIETLGVFSNAEDAYNLRDIAKNSKDSFTYKASTGQIFSYSYVPWEGYFERLSEIHVDKTFIGRD